ncbi:MAG: SpoIIIAH-like family protein [Deltaproteobacteria bacterium]|nr:SpoIIIAH-like family protein [Deltaproteobacteria bacterium]
MNTLKPQPPLNNSRPGMILVTTLVLVLILTVAGGVLLYKNRSELATTTNYRNHQKALTNADTVLKLAMKALDIMVANPSISSVKESFSHDDNGYKYTFSDNFAEIVLNDDQSRSSVKSRYLGAGSTTGGNEPDIIISNSSDQIIGMAKIGRDFKDRTIDYGGSQKAGESIGMTGMGSGSSSVSSFYVITVVGRDPDSTAGDIFSHGAEISAGPQAFLTALYCVGTACEKS